MSPSADRPGAGETVSGTCTQCPPGRTAATAVLFVHGIGMQRPGHTLDKFAGPLLALAGELPGGLPLEGTVTGVRRVERHAPDPGRERAFSRIARTLWGTPRSVAPSSWPVHEIWEVTAHVRGRTLRYRWLLAESCWARSFPLPGPVRFSRLLLLVVPWLALYQMGAAWFSMSPTLFSGPATPRRTGRMATIGLASYFGFAPRLLAMVTTVLLCPVLALIGNVPLLRAPVTLLIDFVGDSLVAMGLPEERARMTAVIRSDLHWCQDRLPQDAQQLVVAHSQGAMLTREMLAGERPRRRTVFFGLGSGLGLLHGVNRSLSIRTGVLGWIAAICMTSMLALLATAAVTSWPLFVANVSAAARDPFGAGLDAALSGPTRPEQLVLVSTVLTFVGAVALRASGLTDLISSWHRDLRLPAGSVTHWREFSSAYDPVSCGSLLEGVADVVVPVVNGPLLPAEHGGYRRNSRVRLEILQAMADASGLRPHDAFVARVWARASAEFRRRRRIARLSTLAVWCLSFAVVVHVYHLLGVGELL
ncbi:hypothetical protein [Streptosporangium sp. H16]|uniref:hypothetical protein n=1 Tax=Streptosporangium sp. H16 TaxID=3444184 RepID=UPI003F7A3ABE